ncbi:MAG: hypothetical protein Q8K75_01525 [Chlamydiales bacterium]|nr:hypothetical protein [Chlamydiales bacterium]
MSTSVGLVEKEGFGTFTGVFVPNVTMMFGVILFMRLSLVLGNVGIWEFAGIMALALLLMLVTSKSIAMIATNMSVGSGGAYYIISRSLGMEIGGAFGIALVLSQLICLCLCTSGFAYSIAALQPDIPIEAVEAVTLSVLTLLALTSSNVALRLQTVICVILVVSIGTIFFSKPDYDGVVIPYLAQPLPFWAAFAMFYPALTGIEAGMAMSGTLKDPAKSLSRGNMLSLIIVAAIYFAIALYLWCTFDVKALQANPMLILQQSRWPAMIYIGIWAATLSTVLGNFVAASRMLQTVAEDGLAPKFLASTYGPLKEPRNALGVIFVVGLCLIMFTTIDQILPILAMICLLTYGILNLVAGLCELVQSPSWRPTYHCPWQLSLLGAALALFFMLMIDPGWAIISIGCMVCIYVWLGTRSHEASFQDFRQTILLFVSRFVLYRLQDSQEHALHWLPHITVFSRGAAHPPKKMIRLAASITKRSGLLSVVSIVPSTCSISEHESRTRNFMQKWLASQSVKCMSDTKTYDSFHAGIENLTHSYSPGPLSPNTLMIPVDFEAMDELDSVASVISTAQSQAKNIMLFFDPPLSTDSVFSRKFLRRKKIEIWWPPENGDSFQLMLSLILSTRSSLTWRNREITLRAIAQDEKAQGHMQQQLQTLLAKMRFKAKADVMLASPEESKDSNLQTYSHQADLVFVALKPITAFDSIEAFGQYLKQFVRELPRSVTTVAVTSYDSLDHREVYAENA